MRLTLASLCLLLFTNCSLRSARVRSTEPWVAEAWLDAVQQLKAPPWSVSEPGSIPSSAFKIRTKDDIFKCGRVKEAVGCFATPNEITVLAGPTQKAILRHEFGHGILYKLGDDRWPCFEHNPCVKEAALEAIH
jgi:hypothetical protein